MYLQQYLMCIGRAVCKLHMDGLQRRVNPVNRHSASKLGPVPKIWSMLFKYNASKLIIFVNWKKTQNFFHWWPVGVKKITIITSNSLSFQWLSCFSCGCKFSLLSCCLWIDCNMHRHSFIQSVLIYYNYCPQQLC